MPNTVGESAPPIFPAMFIIQETVPEYSPPTSIGTAHDGPIVHSRKKSAAVRQYTAVKGLCAIAAGTINATQPSRPTMATIRRENLVFPALNKNLVK